MPPWVRIVALRPCRRYLRGLKPQKRQKSRLLGTCWQARIAAVAPAERTGGFLQPSIRSHHLTGARAPQRRQARPPANNPLDQKKEKRAKRTCGKREIDKTD